MATLARVFEFDAAHRVMIERIKCFNLHGHRFKVEVTFEYNATGTLGYAIDFKELKRIAGDWIDNNLDHATILNPMDVDFIDLIESKNLRLYIMGLGYVGDINPSAENLAEEILFSLRALFSKHPVEVKKVKLYETPNCWVEVESTPFASESVMQTLVALRDKYGVMNYDAREEK